MLAGSTSFFAAKFFTNNSKTKPTTSPSANTSSSKTATAGDSPAPVQSSAVTKAAMSTEKPSNPKDTYVIQKGETLYAVATNQGVTSTQLAEANGISDPNKIQAGQTLIIPKGGEVSFLVDNTKATSLQKDADNGKYQYRLSPEDTARSDASPIYGLTVTDNYTLKDTDATAGTAEVNAIREERTYLIKLVQPITKGDKGIWAIETIRPL